MIVSPPLGVTPLGATPTKRCAACQADLPPEAFGRNRSHPDGRARRCRDCERRRNQQRRRWDLATDEPRPTKHARLGALAAQLEAFGQALDRGATVLDAGRACELEPWNGAPVGRRRAAANLARVAPTRPPQRAGRWRMIPDESTIDLGVFEPAPPAGPAPAGAPGPTRKRTNHTYSERDRAYLLANWGVLPDEQIARKLGTSVNALYQYAWRRLRLRRTHNVTTQHQVTQVLGLDHHALARLVRRGWLRRKRHGRRIDGRTTYWIYDDGELFRLVTERPWLFDPAAMPADHPLTVALRETIGDDPWLTIDEAAATFGYSRGRVDQLAWQYGAVGQFPTERRPHLGTSGGDPGGLIVARRSQWKTLLDGHQTLGDVRRREGARGREALRRHRALERAPVQPGDWVRVVAAPPWAARTQGRLGQVVRVTAGAHGDEGWGAHVALLDRRAGGLQRGCDLPGSALAPILIGEPRP